MQAHTHTFEYSTHACVFAPACPVLAHSRTLLQEILNIYHDICACRLTRAITTSTTTTATAATIIADYLLIIVRQGTHKYVSTDVRADAADAADAAALPPAAET